MVHAKFQSHKVLIPKKIHQTVMCTTRDERRLSSIRGVKFRAIEIMKRRAIQVI